MDSQPSSLSNYGTNLASILTFSALAGIAWCAKNKCKHSKCDLDSGCLKISADDEARKSTIREEILQELREEGLLPPRRVGTGETEV